MNFFSWKTVPFVRFIFPLLFGIICKVFIDLPLRLGIGLMVLGFVGLLVTEFTRDIDRRVFLEKWVFLPLSLMLFGLGLVLVDQHSTIDRPTHFSHQQDISHVKARVKEVPQTKKKSVKIVLEVEQALHADAWKSVEGKLLVYIAKSDSVYGLEIGDELLIPVDYKTLDPPANPGEFNYKRFLSFRDIYHQQYVPRGQWEHLSTSWSARKQAQRWRSMLGAKLAEIGMSHDEYAIASALLLGDKDELDADLTRSYASAGAMHVLAVSGLHVGIIYFILQFILKAFARWMKSPLVQALIIILFLWVYAFITGLSPSVVRAATMLSAVSLASGMGRRSNIYNTIASSAFVLLLFNPLYIMEVGFQLSYLAVLGIIYLHPKIYGLFYFPKKLPDRIWEISAVSISAQLATFPLGLLYFHQFPSYFLLSNLVVIPAAFVILYLGLSYLAFSWLPGLGWLLGQLVALSIAGLNGAVRMVEQLPHSMIQGVDISIIETWLLYIMLALIITSLAYTYRKAFIAGLAVLAILIALQIHELMSFKQHQYLVVYDLRGESVINMLSNKVNHVRADSTWALDPDKQQFHLRNNWNKHAAPEPNFNTDSLSFHAKGLFSYAGKTIFHLKDKSELEQFGRPIQVDYLIISYHKGLSMKRIQEWVEAEQVILDGTVRGKTIERLCDEAPGQSFHVVQEDGYFSARL